jgi:hypothetical protein
MLETRVNDLVRRDVLGIGKDGIELLRHSRASMYGHDESMMGMTAVHGSG